MAIRRLIRIAFGSSRRDFATKALLGQLVFSGVAFIGSVAAARVLGPSGKGVLSGWTTVAALAVLVIGGSSTIGFGRAWLAGQREELAGAVAAHGAQTLAIVLAVAVAAAAVGIDPVAAFVFLVVVVPAAVMFEDLTQVALAAKEALRWQIPRIVNAAVFAVGAIFLWGAGLSGRDELLWVLFAAGSLVGLVIFSISTVRLYGGGHPSFRALRSLTSEYGRGTGPFRVMNFLLSRLDWFVVLLFVGPVGLGLYSVASNWAAIGVYFADAIRGAVFEDTGTLSDAAALKILKTSVFIVGPIEAALLLLAWPLIPALFGADFAEARHVVPFLAPGVIAQAVSQPAWQILVARGKGELVRAITMRALFLGLPALFVLTRSFGIIGAALGSSVAYVIWAWMLSRKFSGFLRGGTSVEVPI